MASLLKCFFSILALIITIIRVHGQAHDFISIDCGYSGSSYQDSVTNLTFTSDDMYVNSGIKNEISTRYKTHSLSSQSLSLRSFPIGSRNCYTIPTNKSGKYLVRATFMYGDYDNGSTITNNKSNTFVFGLHLGIVSWANVTINDSSRSYGFEAITVSSADFISVCLINMKHGTPFISSLEIRPFDSSIYPAVSSNQTLALSFRYNMGPTDGQVIRYPDDGYDRIWRAYNYSSMGWRTLAYFGLSFNYPSNDLFHVPSIVLQSAVDWTPTSNINMSWAPDNFVDNPSYYLILYFCNVWGYSPISTLIDIDYNGGSMSSNPVSFGYEEAVFSYSTSSISGQSSYRFGLIYDVKSYYGPMLSAVEVYYTLSMSAVITLPSDVMALEEIKRTYDITKASWQGDPCAPIGYVWDDIGCNSVNDTLRITSIDLSSSKLTGILSNNFSNLTELEFLDLSHNNLNGPIPDFLGNMTSLKVLNLSRNCFIGPIPNNLLNKSELILRDNDFNSACNSTSQKHTIMATMLSLLGAIFLIGVFVFFIWRKMKISRERPPLSTKLAFISSVISRASDSCRQCYNKGLAMTKNRIANNSIQEIPMEPIIHEPHAKRGNFEDEIRLPEIRKFSYKELEKITNNFVRFVGKGGFGSVYHGYLENTREVAVKVRAGTSSHGMNEFLAEVGYLAKVHHRNLVHLVGYCREENHLGLVYEFIQQGCLTDHLRGQGSRTRLLNWRQRLQIAIDAAQGLNYLHTGCDAPIIHRDVKSSNILLDRNLRAKIADFGLSRAFDDYEQTHMSTHAAGTPGYMDIEHHLTGRLTKKSDVYSFGVVLLELVTGEPPIVPGKGHITICVNEMVRRRNIGNIIDSNLQGNYEMQSILKVVDIAIQCTEDQSKQRPTMDIVVVQLKESLAIEVTREAREFNDLSSNSGIGEGLGITELYSSKSIGESRFVTESSSSKSVGEARAITESSSGKSVGFVYVSDTFGPTAR